MLERVLALAAASAVAEWAAAAGGAACARVAIWVTRGEPKQRAWARATTRAVLAGAVTRLIAGTLVQLLVAHRGGRPALAPILHLTLLGAVIGGVINAGWYRWLDAAIERWRGSVSILPPHEPGQPPTTREVSAARTD